MAGLIPNDYGTASEAIDHGKPLTIMASRTTIAQWYLRGADQLIGEKIRHQGTGSGNEPNKKASFFGRYLSSLGLETRGKPSLLKQAGHCLVVVALNSRTRRQGREERPTLCSQ